MSQPISSLPQVGDEVIDGTILRRINEARRHIAGT